MSGISLDELSAFLDQLLELASYKDESGGVYLPATRPVRRLGVALEPWSGLAAWVREEKLDALFLHRPWALDPTQLPDGVGVIFSHLPFDERLTLGLNPRLAAVLGLFGIEPFGDKEERPIGMIGEIRRQGFATFCRCVEQVFGGCEEMDPGARDKVARVAVVGAMTDALVRGAAERGGDVYVTGQFRQPARGAVRQTGIGAIAVGHRRSEQWGLRALAGVVRERWAGISVVLAPGA